MKRTHHKVGFQLGLRRKQFSSQQLELHPIDYIYIYMQFMNLDMIHWIQLYHSQTLYPVYHIQIYKAIARCIISKFMNCIWVFFVTWWVFAYNIFIYAISQRYHVQNFDNFPYMYLYYHATSCKQIWCQAYFCCLILHWKAFELFISFCNMEKFHWSNCSWLGLLFEIGNFLFFLGAI